MWASFQEAIAERFDVNLEKVSQLEEVWNELCREKIKPELQHITWRHTHSLTPDKTLDNAMQKVAGSKLTPEQALENYLRKELDESPQEKFFRVSWDDNRGGASQVVRPRTRKGLWEFIATHPRFSEVRDFLVSTFIDYPDVAPEQRELASKKDLTKTDCATLYYWYKNLGEDYMDVDVRVEDVLTDF